MFEKYLKHKIIKLLITVFILFLTLNLLLIIFFQLNKKIILFSSNKQINNSEKLKINIMDVIYPTIYVNGLSDDEKKLISINPNLSSKEIILILKERLLNQFQEGNQIKKSYALSQEDAHIKINRNLYYYELPKDEQEYIQKLLHTESKLSEEEIIITLSRRLLSEYSINKQHFNKYVLFLKNKLNHKMINANSLNIKITLKNKEIPDILFYIMMIKTVLEETKYRITILNEQLKDDQKLQLIENDLMNTNDWLNSEEKKILLINPQISSQEMILILKEKIANQFRQNNQLAKYYDAIQQKALPIFPHTPRYISNEDVYLQNIFNKYSYNTEYKIIEHLQKLLCKEYENKKSLLKLCDIVLNQQIFSQIYYITNSMTFETHINEMDQLLNDPLYISFIRIQLDNAINKLMQLHQHIKKIQDQVLIDLEDKQRELSIITESRDKIKTKLKNKKQELIEVKQKAAEDLTVKNTVIKEHEKTISDLTQTKKDLNKQITKQEKDIQDLTQAKNNLETVKNTVIKEHEKTISDLTQ
ncbi:hypothetical protein OC709_02140, partial ['Planchonia careya' phytoplasma]